jgi:hypothetical protein
MLPRAVSPMYYAGVLHHGFQVLHHQGTEVIHDYVCCPNLLNRDFQVLLCFSYYTSTPRLQLTIPPKLLNTIPKPPSTTPPRLQNITPHLMLPRATTPQPRSIILPRARVLHRGPGVLHYNLRCPSSLHRGSQVLHQRIT